MKKKVEKNAFFYMLVQLFLFLYVNCIVYSIFRFEKIRVKCKFFQALFFLNVLFRALKSQNFEKLNKIDIKKLYDFVMARGHKFRYLEI